MSFWENVDQELKFKGIERKELGNLADFPESYISKGITRNSSPSVDLALRIAQALGVSVEYLVTGTNNPSKVNEQEETEQLRLYRKHSEIIKKCEELSPEKEKLLVTFIDTFSK